MTKTHTISPKPLTWALMSDLIDGGYTLSLSDESRSLIQKCRDYLDKKMERTDKPVYGITTGFGSLCNRTISASELTQLQNNLVMSHACSQGTEVAPEIVRLMLFLKAHALSLGHSGVQVQTVERIIDMYNHNVLPVVYDRGSLGASGDLAPLANLFLPLIGMGEVRHNGQLRPAAEVMTEMGWQPITLKSKEGLALLNGTQFMSSHGVYAMVKALRLAPLADLIGCVSLEAFDGRIDPFHPNIHTVRPHQGQQDVAAHIRELLQGSELIARPKKHVQDPYSFRCMPQVHGASRDAINYVASVLLTEINSVTDNPTVFPDDDMVISGGNFHGQPLALVYDFLAIALAELGNISERRTAQLILGLRELPEFLVANPGLNSGFMIPQYAAAAMVSQNKQLCTPASVDSIVSSNGQEDHVSMGGNAATKLLRVVDNLERILAIELIDAAQALEFRRPAKSSPKVEAFVAGLRKQVPFITEDKVMYTEIDKTLQYIRQVRL
ncbi:MAG: histidine ammonia-lyase [Bacteroidales bacterium]|nr:histidine ammonia-lyase [Bacteroidales bacterium]